MMWSFANALEARPGLVLVNSPSIGNQTCHRLPVPGNDDLFVSLHAV
jgi:hypothetical protein